MLADMTENVDNLITIRASKGDGYWSIASRVLGSTKTPDRLARTANHLGNLNAWKPLFPGTVLWYAPSEIGPTDLPGWSLIYDADFAQEVPLGQFPEGDDQWLAYPSNYYDTSRNGQYHPGKVCSIVDGILSLYLHTDLDFGPRALVSAPIPNVSVDNDANTFGNWPDQLYGRYEVTARFDHLPGYKVAWLLWPMQGTNTTDANGHLGGNGEIDFPEMSLDSSTLSGFVHHQGAVVGNDQKGFHVRDFDPTVWHTYVIEWSPNLVRFLLDGEVVGSTTERVPDTPMHWVLQTETRLSGLPPEESVSGYVEISNVTVWSYDESASGASNTGR